MTEVKVTEAIRFCLPGHNVKLELKLLVKQKKNKETLKQTNEQTNKSWSQRGLQGGVKDVVMVTVAVGVAVVALRAWAVGGFLQSHQHVHLEEENIYWISSL